MPEVGDKMKMEYPDHIYWGTVIDIPQVDTIQKYMTVERTNEDGTNKRIVEYKLEDPAWVNVDEIIYK